MSYLWVAIGGALGSVARYFFSGVIANRFGAAFPNGTLFVNVTGAIVIGIFAALSLPEGRMTLPPPARLFLMTGICGGYTTFSTFSLETFNLLRDGEWTRALANIALSVGLCLLAVWCGLILGLRLGSRG
ncbi:MAG TPA: fluoride efflux transporter CrcB [Candidatus Binataceae bacterium]|nr:fluoride efflux transporter CrcB [Candidatus Binataceae bacterium]